MIEACEMKLEPLAETMAGSLKLEVVASRQMCIDPAEQLNPWDYAAFLQVTNTGLEPVPITFGEGSFGDRAFRMDYISEMLKDREPTRLGGDGVHGPSDPAEGSIVEQVLAPGASARVTGNPTYILSPIQRAVNGESLSGLPVPEENRWLRKFKIEFLYWITANEADVTGTLSTDLEVVVKQPDEQ